MRLVRKRRMNGGSSTPSICTRIWFNAIPEPMPPIMPGAMKSLIRRLRRSSTGG